MTPKLGITFTGLNEARLAKIRATAPGWELIITDKDDAALADCEVIFGHIAPQILSLAKNLKWFHSQWAGVDSYLKLGGDLRANLLFTSSSGAYGVGIAEHLITVTLMLLRKMGGYGRLQFAHKWESLGTVKSLRNAKVTVVGMGDIGGKYAEHCHSFGAQVSGVVRTPRANKPAYIDTLYCADQLDQAIADADIVALCLPGTVETEKIFDKNRLSKLKKGAFILNIGRGTAIDTAALIEFLESGHLAGAGLDVTDPEPLPTDSPLWDMPNVIITPHVSGGDSLDLTQDLITDKFIRYLQDYLAGRPFERVVNRQAGY